MHRHIEALNLSWKGSKWVALFIATFLYTFSFVGLTAFINFAWFGRTGQNALGTPPCYAMDKSILNMAFFFQMVLFAQLRVMNHSVRI